MLFWITLRGRLEISMSFPICNSVQIDSDPPPLSVTRPTLIRVTIQFNARYVYHIAIEIWIIYELIEYICTFQSKYGLYTIRVFSLGGRGVKMCVANGAAPWPISRGFMWYLGAFWGTTYGRIRRAKMQQEQIYIYLLHKTPVGLLNNLFENWYWKN